VHPDDRQGLMAAWQAALAAGADFRREFRIRRHDGAYRWFGTRARPLRDSQGRILKWFGSNTDIHEERERRETLRRQSLLLELAYDPILVWHRSEGIVFWNHGCQQLYGYTTDEALGQAAHVLLQTVFPVSFGQFEAEFERDGQWSGDLRHTTKEGRAVIVSSRVQQVETGGGHCLVLEANRDITEQKAAERIGKGAEKYAMAIRGKSLANHDPRMSPALGTANIADANPAHHMDSQITGMLAEGASIGTDPALQASRQNSFASYAIGSEYHQLLNASGMCSLYTVATTPPPIADLIAGASGWDFGWEEAMAAGRRILTLRQAFNAREGLTPDQFELPKRITSTVKTDYGALRDGYFSEMKWDLKSGKPSKECLSELGLAELASDL
jgi:PAS domain S-box-containing protein